jgi:hypothetical protein
MSHCLSASVFFGIILYKAEEEEENSVIYKEEELDIAEFAECIVYDSPFQDKIDMVFSGTDGYTGVALATIGSVTESDWCEFSKFKPFDISGHDYTLLHDLKLYIEKHTNLKDLKPGIFVCARYW